MDEPRPPAALRIGSGLYARVLAHAVAARPVEAVGLLAVADEVGHARATEYYPGTNVDASPTRYTMDPAEVLAALRDIEACGWRLGAIVHSHPTTSPIPSATDLREAHYPDALIVIVGLANAPVETRAWRLVAGTEGAGTFAEVPILVDRHVPDLAWEAEPSGRRPGLGGSMGRTTASARTTRPGA